MKNNSVKRKKSPHIVFKLTDENITGPSFLLQSTDNHRARLLHNNRPIRYSVYHRTPFVDEQEGEIGREIVEFVEGNLVVHESNESLLNFLRVHPQNGVTFWEVDHEKIAREELEELNLEADALIFAKQADIDVISSVVRVLMGSDVDNMTTAEIRRDAMILAKRDPEGILSVKSDPSFEVKDIAARSIAEGHLGLRNQGRDIYYNFPDRKAKLLTVPMGEEPASALERWFLSDDGVETYTILKKMLEHKV